MKKLLASLFLLLIPTVGRAITYQSVRASTATNVSPTIQTGTMNLSSGTITNLNSTTLKGATGTFSGVVTAGSFSPASSLPSGSTQYIQNTTTLQSNSAFNVSTGTVSSMTVTAANINTLTVLGSGSIGSSASVGGALVVGAGLTINGTFDAGVHKLINVSTPTLSTDAATKGYADSLSSGNTAYIQNGSAVQAATFNVSSGTVATLRTGSLISSGTVNLGGTLNSVTISTNIIFSTTTAGIVGTNTNSDALPGNQGQYIESIYSGVNCPTSTNWGDAASIPLTGGDWDVSLGMVADKNTATQLQFTDMNSGISVTTGNSTTGLTFGSNYMEVNEGATGLTTASLPIPPYRISLTGPTTVYAKLKCGFSSGQPVVYGRISARRPR